MRKISEMYEHFKGTDYRRTCNECKNCIQQSQGKRVVYKCRSYGITSSSATDWKPSYIACKGYNKPVPKQPIFFQDEPKREEQIEGQMSILDFI